MTKTIINENKIINSGNISFKEETDRMPLPVEGSGCITYRTENSEIRLFNQDCIKGMREHVQKGTVDVVVTSPPYNLGIKYSKYDDTIPRQEYLNWLCKWASTIFYVLSEEGSLFLNIGAKPSDPWGPFEVLNEMRKYFELQNIIHWIKSIAIDVNDVGRDTGITKNVSMGHYKPINRQ